MKELRVEDWFELSTKDQDGLFFLARKAYTEKKKLLIMVFYDGRGFLQCDPYDETSINPPLPLRNDKYYLELMTKAAIISNTTSIWYNSTIEKILGNR